MIIKEQLQNTDIYIIDQLLKGNFDELKSVLDVGCGAGRNLVYFLQNDFDVFGIDPNENRLNETKEIALELNPSTPSTNFKIATAELIPFKQNFDLIICNAVLHFAKNKTQFETILFSIWEKLNDNGILFIRLASNIGIENLVEPTGNGNYQLSDGTTRYLVSEKMLLDYTQQLNGELLEPIKTTNVQSLRCMTTWILKK
jgi:2-polyprenyl-3-methyl-5-hydroxy-6-metoxy-1,4-benzoquinol methylase